VGKKISLVWRSDVHLADEAPKSRKDNWVESLTDKLKQVGVLAELHGASAILDGGDFFHIKSPILNSHWLTQQASDIHTKYPCPTYANIGNHDVKYGNTTYLDESPLGVLFSSQTFRRLYDTHELVIEDAGIKVRVVGIPYHGTSYDMSRFNIKKQDEDWLVVVAHVLASKSGGTMFGAEDVVSYQDLSGFDPDVWCFGHSHSNQGIEHLNGKHFVNIGSLSRGALNNEDFNRIPSVALLTFTKGTVALTEIPLSVKGAGDVFRVDEKKAAIEKSVSLEDFMDSLKDNLQCKTDGSLESVVRDMDLDSIVKERLLHYIEIARG
jgi:DNA repair exonuclease SbcCD nuclease subunit